METEEFDRQVVGGLHSCMKESTCPNIRIHEICCKLPGFSYGDNQFTGRVRRSLRRLGKQGFVEGRGYGGGFYYELTPQGYVKYGLEFPEVVPPKTFLQLPTELSGGEAVVMMLIDAFLRLRGEGVTYVPFLEVMKRALADNGLDPERYSRSPFIAAMKRMYTNRLVTQSWAGSDSKYSLTARAVAAYGHRVETP